MAGYFVANYAITNLAGYKEYFAAVGPVLEAHGAENIVIDHDSARGRPIGDGGLGRQAGQAQVGDRVPCGRQALRSGRVSVTDRMCRWPEARWCLVRLSARAAGR
jgi:hypothetical protein